MDIWDQLRTMEEQRDEGPVRLGCESERRDRQMDWMKAEEPKDDALLILQVQTPVCPSVESPPESCSH